MASIYPYTVHDLWLALTRLPPNLPVSAGRNDAWYDIERIETHGPEGGVGFVLTWAPTTTRHADELADAQRDVEMMLAVFEAAVLAPAHGPPPPPIPVTDAVRKLLTDIRARFEQVGEDDEDTIPF